MKRNKNRKEPKKRPRPCDGSENCYESAWEKNAQRDPGEKGRTCNYCKKEGHLKQGCSQIFEPLPAPCPVYKVPHGRRDCSQRHTPQGLDSQDNQDWRCLGFPTEAPILTTPEEHSINNRGRPISQFSFEPWGNFLCTHWSPWSTFLLIHYCNGTVWMSQKSIIPVIL